MESNLAVNDSSVPASPPFRFYDNRQKYLAFVNTCNEKAAIVTRAAQELAQLRPTPPALRIFDAGMGDATVLSRLMRSDAPLFPDRAAARGGQGDQPRGRAAGAGEDAGPVLRASGDGARDHQPQLRRSAAPDAARRAGRRGAQLAGGAARPATPPTSTPSRSRSSADAAHGWETKPSPKTGNPTYVRPSVLVDLPRGPRVPARRGDPQARAQPFERLRPGARLAALARAHVRRVQGAEGPGAAGAQPRARRAAAGDPVLRARPGAGDHPEAWPGENPFPVDRHAAAERA